jgi:subtilisin family serine protease
LALALGVSVTLPWVASGALGSLPETAGSVLAALLFGFAAALVINTYIMPYVLGHHRDGQIPVRNLLTGGLAAGTVLLIMGGASGYRGQQLLLIIALPAIGWAVVALLTLTQRIWPAALFLALAIVGPYLFVDGAEMAIAVAFGLSSLLGYAFQSAFYAVLIGLVSGLLLLFASRSLPRRQSGRSFTTFLFPLLALASVGLAVAIYFLLGQPGFYGDHLYVVLRDQASLDVDDSGSDLTARRADTYELLVSHAQDSQGDLRQELERFGIEYTPFYLVNAIEVEGGPLLQLWLSQRPDVDRVLPNPTLRPSEPEVSPGIAADAPVDTLWNLSIIGADRVWQELGVTGSGIVVGQSDSGVEWEHRELQDSYRGGSGDHDYNWYDPWYHSTEPVDAGGHGTHTLGTVLGNQTGVAPDATWFGCSNLARNLGNPALYLECMQFMLAPFPIGGDPFQDGDPALGADVLNNSWGCPSLEGCDATSLLPAVRALRASGIFVVVSAGNEGPNCSSLDAPPAIYDEVFSIGAINSSRQVTSFSSRGPVTVDGSGRTKPDVVAPGFDILSAFPGGTYRAWEGTSMAGPHVAGVVALMWSANPQLVGDIELTEQILRETAQPNVDANAGCTLSEELPNNNYGYGLVDAYAAVERALELAAGP